MDAGARGRRLLQRREYRAKVSEFIPKELEDHVVYENPNTNLFSDKTSDRIINSINRASDAFKNNKVLRTIGKVFKSKNPGSNYTKDGKVVADSYVPEASSAQEKAMHDAKLKKMEDDKVASKKKKVDEACWKGYEKKGMKTMFGKRYPNCVKKTKKEEVEVAEDMKGMSQKSGDKRSTESGAGMTAQGVAKYNRRTGGNLKTAVTTPPSKLKPGSKAAKRRKSFCARSKSWTGPRGKAARRRWNCSYEPELPMIIDEKKKLFNTAPLSDRVSNWSKKITEASPLTPGRNDYGLPTNLKSSNKKTKTTKVNPNKLPVAEKKEYTGKIDGNVLKAYPELDPNKPGDYIRLKRLSSKMKRITEIKKLNPNAVFPTVSNVKIKNEIISDGGISNKNSVKKKFPTEAKMTSSEKDKKEKYVKGMKKDKKGFTKRYGKDGESVMYATATKMAMKEESCGKGEYYCYDDKKCKPIPEGMKVGKDGMLVKEAKYEKGASTYGKASIRNKRAYGYGGNAKPPAERGAAITRRKDEHMARRGVKKGNKYAPDKYKPTVYGRDEDNDKYRKNKNVSENIFKGVKGDGYLGRTPIPNPIRLAKDVVDTVNRQQKNRIDKLNKISPNSASINIPKPFNTSVSPASTRYLGLKNEGSLHKWFKGSKSKDGKPGWVNVVTGGTCASDKPGEGTPKCVSSSKRASMSKAERLSASRRKKKADPGQQSKSGAAKPTYVATDKKKKKVDENAGPSTPVTRVGGGFLPNLGAGRLNDKKIRLKINPLAGLPKV